MGVSPMLSDWNEGHYLGMLRRSRLNNQPDQPT
jgi:hypothetical protein